MNNGYKTLLFFTGAMAYVFFPPLFLGDDYMFELVKWIKPALVGYLALVIVVSYIMISEDKNDNKGVTLDIERRCNDHIKSQTKKAYIIASAIIAPCLVFLWWVSV